MQETLDTIRAVFKILNQLPYFSYVIFGASITMSGNEATRYLGQASCSGNSELPGGVQAKPHKAFNSAASRRFLDVHFFKVDE